MPREGKKPFQKIKLYVANVCVYPRVVRVIFYICLVCFLPASDVGAQEERKKVVEIYGEVCLDAGYNFGQIHPDWYDIMRPSKFPAYKNEYGTDGNTYYSVRQTGMGFKTYLNTAAGELKTIFEYDLFGTGRNEGQTKPRLNIAYGELGRFGAGQYWSPFMDEDVFPDIVEYWGPSGMVFFRNIQVRYMPIQGDTRLTIALEAPGASADQGIYANRIELEGVEGRFPVPDLSAEYHLAQKWGYAELAGIVRRIEWEDLSTDSTDLSGSAIGWGLNFSTNIHLGKKSVFKGQLVYGKGIENYMDDAPIDIGVKNEPYSRTKPIVGVALPVIGIVAFVDHSWSEKFTSSAGYSMVHVWNSNAEADTTFKRGQYVAANLLYHPVENMIVGIEFQWGSRANFKDGWFVAVPKIQFSVKCSFNRTVYRK